MTTGYYRYTADETGKSVFRSNEGGAELTPEQLAEKFVRPFLFDEK
jgi:hypothetical protein